MLDITVDEIEMLLPYLYRLDAREASARLVEKGAAAVDPLLRVLDGSYPLPTLERHALTAVEEALLECTGIESPLNAEEARARAAYLLGMIGSPRAVAPLMAAFRREQEPLVTTAIVRALGEIGDRRTLDILVGALCADTEFETLKAAITGVAAIGDARGARGLLALVDEILALPPEAWDEHGSNLRTNDAGITEHIARTELWYAVDIIRQIGDRDARATLDALLANAPDYVTVIQ